MNSVSVFEKGSDIEPNETSDNFPNAVFVSRFLTLNRVLRKITKFLPPSARK